MQTLIVSTAGGGTTIDAGRDGSLTAGIRDSEGNDAPSTWRWRLETSVDVDVGKCSGCSVRVPATELASARNSGAQYICIYVSDQILHGRIIWGRDGSLELK